MMVLEYYPEAFIELNKELQHHEKLQLLLANHPMEAFEVKLAEIASYCDVVLNATYTKEDLIRLAGILRERLIKKRQGILLISSPGKLIQ